ncbi:golgin subfamily A member 4-like isoform X2 [Suncus etruscus]|uniref:golgin subfamily A member 4-like isoform X2 n=1 Tax=Suncus etruscus TaxID=109475 RepID=UPI0021109863|nr:golgin subfamily A member 4-like isoform X2 [Suncus etruscus]
MFKKLKQKISEEQQQQQQQQLASQTSSNTSTPTRDRSRTSSFTEQADEGTPNREAGDSQSFVQKLQLRVPSVESLFRSPIKESLFRSPSKEPLVRTSSRESLTRFDLDSDAMAFDPPSDLESEAEDSPGNLDNLSREHLIQWLRRMERRLKNCNVKYSELAAAYQTLQREKKKLHGILSQSQDKSLRRIAELREELQMDQQAKKHLQEEFDASLEEKDQYISVLQTQVALLKQRLRNGPMNLDLQTPLPPAEPQAEDSPKERPESDTEQTVVEDEASAKTLETLQRRVKRQENLLQLCKKKIQTHKEQCTLLTSEKEALQEQLDERLQELENMKERHMAEKTKFITQLRDAKNVIEQLEQDKGMVIAETKRQMHETLEMKEEEIAQLRSRIKQMTTQGEELREQKEKSERAAFEELEKALSTAQKSEEAWRKMKAEKDEQIKMIEKASEEERLRLQQELSRVKQEVVDGTKKFSEQIANLQKLHEEELASKEQKLTTSFQKKEQELQQQMKAALEKSPSEYLKITQAKEQQELLAREELELQKKAIFAEGENKLRDLHQEVEAYRTRILELESYLEKNVQESKNQSEDLATHLEAEKNKHNKEITVLVEKHKTELESLQHQQDNLWTEKLQVLQKQHQTAMETLREKHEQEKETLLKDKEILFQAHIEEMNKKTLEKLDMKQTEVESLSSELSEVFQARDKLDTELSVLKDQAEKVKQELEAKLDEQKNHHQQQVDSIIKEQEISLQRTEKALKDEINHLGILLKEKDKQLKEQQVLVENLEAEIKRSEGELQQAAAKLDFCQSHQNIASEQTKAYEEQLVQLQQKLLDLETEKSLLTKQVTEVELQKKDVCTELDTHKIQVQDLMQQLEKHSSDMEAKVKSLTQFYESQIKDNNIEQQQTKQILMEKENIILQMKGQNKEIEILKQKLSAKEDSITVLREEYETKFKNQEKKMEKIKQKGKEMQEALKKKLLDQEAKLKKELENTVLELSQKEKQFNAKILEMAQANSAGINDAVSKLEMNQKEQIESLTEVHKRELNDVISVWEKKLNQQSEELQEKHETQLQEREQEVAELKQKILMLGCEKEEMSKEIEWLKEEGVKQDTVVKEFKEQFNQKSAHVNSLLEKETQLKAQLKKLEVDLDHSLKENASQQEHLVELKTLAEKDKLKISELTDKLKATDEEFQSLKAAHERNKKSLENKSLEFKTLSEELIVQLDLYSKETEALLQAKTDELINSSSTKINALLSRISHCQNRTTKVQEVLLMKTRKVSDLESQLKQLTEEWKTLHSSFQQASNQLEEKENQIRSMKAEREGLVREKEALQMEGGHQQQAASEKESCITQLKKELAENTNALTLMKEELNEKKLEICSLSKQLTDLNDQLQNSVSITEKEEAISSLRTCYDEEKRELQDQVQNLSLKTETLNNEKISALEREDHLSKKFSEWKKKAQSKFTQYQNTIKELQMQLELKAKEVSEKDRTITLLKEDLDQQNKTCESLKSEMEDKMSQLHKTESNLETELKTQAARIMELEELVAHKTNEIESLGEVLKNDNQQKDIERNEIAQKLQHIQELEKEKDKWVKEAEKKVSELEEQVSSLKSELETTKKELEYVDSSMKGKEQEFRALEEKLELEHSKKLAELKKKAEQKIAAIKKQLLSQRDEKEQHYKKDTERHLNELHIKLREREDAIHILEEKLKSTESSPPAEMSVVPRSANSLGCAEQEDLGSQGCVHQACEEKISVLQRDLMAKEKLLQKLELEREETAASHSEMQCKYQELLKKIEHTEAKQQEDQVMISHLQEKTMYSLEASQQVEEKGGKNDKAKQNLENVNDNVQKALQEKELAYQMLEKKMKELDSCLVREKEAHRAEVDELTSKYEKLQALQQQMDEKRRSTNTWEESATEKSKSLSAQPRLHSNTGTEHNDLEFKLAGAEQEKQKLGKEIVQLQKDLRGLRKEHQQELDIMKKEHEQEIEERIRQEQEDLELKHNSTLKQLMREFNTQLAQKEQELEVTIKETIDKAQEVEAELLESHQEETNKLHKKIAEKEDDLKRTAKRYEEILDAREEEMTAKVKDLQTQLAELQEKYQQRLQQEEGNQGQKDSMEVTIKKLQTQLAQKTTLVSDSKLKEQEFQEQIHNLEDRLKKYEKNVCEANVEISSKDGNLFRSRGSLFEEPTEFEYLRKVLYEYMMGRETKTMAKVITTVLKFPEDQTQRILEREDARPMYTSPRSGIF